jgi:azurin
MQFEQTEFTVPAGEEITLTFENTATSAAMKHNVVLLTTNDDAAVTRVGQAGTRAADNEYIPDDDAVLAATGLADPGETVTVTFTAPSEPGSYRYICTVPGHYMTMQGTMTVVSS